MTGIARGTVIGKRDGGDPVDDGGECKRVEFRHAAVWIHRRVSCSIRRSQAAHCELDMSVWQLPPMLNNRHITAMRNLIDDFACLEASRFYR